MKRRHAKSKNSNGNAPKHGGGRGGVKLSRNFGLYHMEMQIMRQPNREYVKRLKIWGVFKEE